jgi:lysophospholipase L1-like esterase
MMRRCLNRVVLVFAAALLSANALAADPEFEAKPRPAGPFQLLEGDRVLFIGETLIERAQTSDYLETFLTARFPDRNVIFRNLGWSGDTVFGDARAGFGTAADGFRQLKDQVWQLRPTLIFAAYGGASSFDGEKGLSRFAAGYATLLDMLEATKAHVVLVSPIRHEDVGRPFPDPTQSNRQRELYRNEIARIARERGHGFIDLFRALGEPAPDEPHRGRHVTDNGIHLSAYGYWRLARAFEAELKLPPERWQVGMEANGSVVQAEGTNIDKVEAPASGTLRFRLTDNRLPEPPAPGSNSIFGRRTLQVRGLPAGRYRISVDGNAVANATEKELAAGLRLGTGPEFTQVEKLRGEIIEKNRLYFYRWRPQNETYLFGFRKHEQGQNAKEVPMFDPLVAAKEAAIAVVRVPVAHDYEIRPE